MNLAVGNSASQDVFVAALAKIRERYQFPLLGYVVMPRGQPKPHTPKTGTWAPSASDSYGFKLRSLHLASSTKLKITLLCQAPATDTWLGAGTGIQARLGSMALFVSQPFEMILSIR